MDFKDLLNEVQKELTADTPEPEVSEIMLTTLYILEREGFIGTQLGNKS